MDEFKSEEKYFWKEQHQMLKIRKRLLLQTRMSQFCLKALLDPKSICTQNNVLRASKGKAKT